MVWSCAHLGPVDRSHKGHRGLHLSYGPLPTAPHLPTQDVSYLGISHCRPVPALGWQIEPECGGRGGRGAVALWELPP